MTHAIPVTQKLTQKQTGIIIYRLIFPEVLDSRHMSEAAQHHHY